MQTRTTDGYVVSGEATMIDIYIYNIGVLTVKIVMFRCSCFGFFEFFLLGFINNFP
jgi:hypothetical protein